MPATRSRASSASATPSTCRCVTFVDCPGFLPGTDQEYGGVIRHGAKIIYAYCEATVPKISIVTRKAMGGAYVAMGSKQMRTDLAFAWPTAQIAVMGAAPAVRVLYRDEVRNAADPAQREAELVAEYREQFFNPYRAADVGQIDEVIEPRETRPRLVRALEVLRTKVQQNPPKKHGLSPTVDQTHGQPELGSADDRAGHGPGVRPAGAAVGLADAGAAAGPAPARARPRSPAPTPATPTPPAPDTERAWTPNWWPRSWCATLAHRAHRRREAAPAMRSYWPGSQLYASRWVAVGRARQNQSWQRRGRP